NYGSGGPHLNIPLGTRSTFTPDTTTDPTKYVLNVIGASKSLQWTGLNGSTWDVVGVPDGNPGVINWTDGTIDEKFFNLDSVTFGDTTPTHGPVSTYAVSINGQVAPNDVVFNNSAGDYALSGSGGITTTINGGTLYVGNGGNVGSLGTGNVVDNANLVFSRTDQITVANAITGTGVV